MQRRRRKYGYAIRATPDGVFHLFRRFPLIGMIRIFSGTYAECQQRRDR